VSVACGRRRRNYHFFARDHDKVWTVRLPIGDAPMVRGQGRSMPTDERYFGRHPGGTTGADYRELNGAKPLDQPWHIG
jgi:hypothetical protein